MNANNKYLHIKKKTFNLFNSRLILKVMYSMFRGRSVVFGINLFDWSLTGFNPNLSYV